MALEHYIETVVAQTNGRHCHKCKEKIPRGAMYLHMERNRHVYCVCGKCLYIFASLAIQHDPLYKSDAAAELI